MHSWHLLILIGSHFVILYISRWSWTIFCTFDFTRSMTLSKILCKWKQGSALSLFLYLNSVFKNKHKLVHNQAPVMNRLCPFLRKHSVNYRYWIFIYNNSDSHYEPNSCSRYYFVAPICCNQSTVVSGFLPLFYQYTFRMLQLPFVRE